MLRLFISYARTDQEAADYLAEHVRARGADVFIDYQRLAAGENFVGRLGAEIDASDCLLFLISPRSVDSKWVQAEVTWAFTKNKRILPVRLQEADLTAFFYLANVDFVDFSRWWADRQMEDAVRKLARSLGLPEDPPQGSPAPASPAPLKAAPNLAELNRRVIALERIAAQVRSAEDSPLYAYRRQMGYHPAIGEGSPQAGIMLVGQSPGEQEAKTGRSFVGASGRVLDELLASIGLEREDIYITNIVKDRAPGSRDPDAAEIAYYAPFLAQQIAIIQPRALVPLGRYAAFYLLDQHNIPRKGLNIGKLRGQIFQAQAEYGPVAIVPLYHPAVVLYSPNQRADLELDFQALRPWVG